MFAMASKLIEGFLPSPWMIMHAMFDNEGDAPLVHEFYELAEESGVVFEKFNVVCSALTMKSARNHEIQNETDILAEILTQAVVTANGFVYNETGDEEVDAFLEQAASLVSSAKQEMNEFLRGKAVFVDVSDLG